MEIIPCSVVAWSIIDSHSFENRVKVHFVDLHSEPFHRYMEMQLQIQHRLVSWCEDMVGPENYMESTDWYYEFSFKNLGDALMFKLAFSSHIEVAI